MVSEILALDSEGPDSELLAFSMWSHLNLNKVGALSRKLCSDGPAVVLMRVCLVSPVQGWAGLLLQGLVGIYVGWLEAVWMVGGPRRPNFNPFLTGHHSILCRRSQIIFHIKYYMWKRCEKKGSRYAINAMIRIYEEATNIIWTAYKPSWTTLGLSTFSMTTLISNKVHLFTVHRNMAKGKPWAFHFHRQGLWSLKARSWQCLLRCIVRLLS